MKQYQRLYSCGAATIAILAAMLVFVVAPTVRQRDALHEDSQKKLAAIARLNETGDASGAADAKLVDLRQTLARFESRLPPAGQMNQIAEDIWQLAEAKSLQSRSLKASSGKPTGNYLSQELDFTLAGRSAAFEQFLLQLEQLPFPVRVEKISMNRLGDSDQMQIDMTLVVFSTL